MSDPPLSEIDFKNKMAWVWTTLKSFKNESEKLNDGTLLYDTSEFDEPSFAYLGTGQLIQVRYIICSI